MSVLFCDLVGYTTLSEGLEADEVRELLSGYFDVARTIVARYGGEVGKFIGDAVMAVWGATAAREDDAERAVRAALELVEAVPAYGAARGRPIQCRVGVVTGRAAATVTPGEGIVVGDRVNTAARAQSAADPGRVLVDDATRTAAQMSIAFADAGVHDLKGKAEPVRLWRAERAVAGASGSLRADGLEAGFVGRAAELRLLKELFHASAERRTVRLVSVIGPAGSGKTRLRWEFRKYLDGLADTVFWHSGRCLAYGEGVAYWAVAEMVRQRFGIAEDDPMALVAEKLAAGLERWIAAPDERAFLHPRLAQLLGVSADADLTRDDLFSGWRLFFERLAAQSPVVLAVEDLHWADPGLLSFLEHMLEWSTPSPIFILTLARAELADRTEWSVQRHATVLSLEPLDDESMGQLLDDLVVDLPEAVRDRIVAHAEGIPLFAVETVRSLIDRDLVVPRDGEYHLAGEVHDLDVPPTLTSLLTARLDSLPPDERALVKDLSVLGTSFSRASMDATSHLDDEEMDRLLASLRRKEILSVRSDPLSPDQGQYTFTQNLLRTVAYESLTRRERKARHLAAAQHLQAACGDDAADVAEVVAAHLDRAMEADPGGPDADQLRAQAAAAHARAGWRASAVGSPDLALRAFRRAAELSAEDMATAELLLEAARAASAGGLGETAAEVAADAQRRFEQLEEHQAAVEALAIRCRALEVSGHFDAALALVQPAVKALAPDAQDTGACRLLLTLGRILTWRGAHDEAAPALDRAAAIAEGLDDPSLLGVVLSRLAMIRAMTNRPVEAVALFRAALEIGDPNSEEGQAALSNLAFILAVNDEPALGELERSLATARRLGMRHGVVVAQANLFNLYLLLGDWDAAQQAITGAAAMADPESSPIIQAWSDASMAVLAARRGDVPAARKSLVECDRLRHSEDAQDRFVLAAAEAVVQVAAGEFDEVAARVVEQLQEAVAVFGLRSDAARQLWPEGIDAAVGAGRLDVLQTLVEMLTDRPPGHVPPFLRGVAARGRALLQRARGRVDGVESDLRAAVAEFERLGYRHVLAQAQLDLAGWLHSTGRTSEAEALETEANAALTRIGAVLPQLVS